MAEVATKNLKTYFGEVKAVDGIDLQVKDGEFMVLLGPSGCGKTTLLRTIAGLERPIEGEVLIGGEVVNELPPRARKLAMVFQSYALYPHKSVYNNIAFPLQALRMGKEEIEDKVTWAAELVGIQPLLDRYPRELSGGEQQRVATARAMVQEPDAFLFDEPLSNLDAKLRQSARDQLKRFHGEIETTFIYVTHDQVEAMGLGERIAVINAGKMRQTGPPDKVYENPSDTFVATFLGSPSMNLIEQDDKIMGFRPENFLPAEAFASHQNLKYFKFYVWRVEHLGSERLLYGSFSKGDTSNKIIARLPANITLSCEEGECYEFAVRAKDLRYFHPETGRLEGRDARG